MVLISNFTLLTGYRRSESHFSTLAPGLYLHCDEHGKFVILLDRKPSAGWASSPGGEILVQDVQTLAVVAGRFVCGTFLSPRKTASEFFIIDLRVKPSDIDAEILVNSNALNTKISQAYQQLTPTLSRSENW